MKKHLNVDLVAVDGTNTVERLDLLLSIARYSQQQLSFNSIKIFTGCTEYMNHQMDGVQLIPVVINSIDQYNHFILKRLHKHINSEHCLIYQHDGFIHTPSNWSDLYMQYDYVGAVWPDKWWCPQNRVGNGGFSLRSKRLLNTLASMEVDSEVNEDMYICINSYEHLIAKEIKFAPPEVACEFSIEEDTEFNNDIDKTFGFHGSSERKHLYGRTLALRHKLL